MVPEIKFLPDSRSKNLNIYNSWLCNTAPALTVTHQAFQVPLLETYLSVKYTRLFLDHCISKQNIAKTFAEVTKPNTPPSFTDIVNIIKRQDQLKERTPKKKRKLLRLSGHRLGPHCQRGPR